MRTEDKELNLHASVRKWYANNSVNTRDSVSADGFYILKKNSTGEIVKKVKALTFPRSYYGDSMLFWPGWINQIPRLEALIAKLKKRQGQIYQELKTKIKAFAGTKKKNIGINLGVVKYHDEVDETYLKRLNCEFSQGDRFFREGLGSKKPRNKEEVLSYSTESISLPLWQLPQSFSKEEQEVAKLLTYKDNLYTRISSVSRGLGLALSAYIDPLLDYYDNGEQILFTIGTKEYSFRRVNYAWEQVSIPQSIQLKPFNLADSKVYWKNEISMAIAMSKWDEDLKPKASGKKKTTKTRKKK